MYSLKGGFLKLNKLCNLVSSSLENVASFDVYELDGSVKLLLIYRI